MVTGPHKNIMNKNTVLAFLLIALILILMPQYYKMIGLADEKPLSKETNDSTLVENATQGQTSIYKPSQEYVQQDNYKLEESYSPKPISSVLDTVPEIVLTIETDLYVANISSKGGGTLQSYELKNYDHWGGGKVNLINNQNAGNPMLAVRIGADIDTLSYNFLLEEGYENGEAFHIKEPLSLTFSHQGVIAATKTLTFHPDSYLISVDAEVAMETSSPKEVYFIWSSGLPITEKNQKDDKYYFGANLLQGGETLSIDNDDKKPRGSNAQTDWVAVRTKYFTSALIPVPRGKASSGLISTKKNKSAPLLNTQLGFEGGYAGMDLYLGPLKYDRIVALDAGLEQTMNLGWSPIRPIGKGILWILTNLYTLIPNYGVLLVVFSILVKVLLHPLTRKSHKSTKEMQSIQPLVAELREKYKGDSQRLNQETMKLYKEHGVNPLGGCLPMLLQMPILIALFTVFRSTIEFRGAPFILWITDLSQPDQLFNLPFTIPFLGWNTLNVLPILMGVTMLYQQKAMSAQSPSQQKSFMYIMNAFFMFIFYNFPSGLNLYYTCFNVLTILQQKYLVHPSIPTSKTKTK